MGGPGANDGIDFGLTVEHPGERTVVAVAGELDIATADQLLAAMHEHLPRGPVLLDLRGLRFIDSSGVRALSRLIRDAGAHGWTLGVGPSLSANVRQVLELTGLITVLPLERA